MSQQHQNARLNDVLIRIHRNLLQYAGECWPWSAVDHAEEQAVIFEMVAEQRDETHDLVWILQQRGWNVEFGTYPTDYTDLHYISLEYLLDRLVAEQKQLIQDVESAIVDCAEDPRGRTLLETLRPRLRNRLDKLHALASARTAAGASEGFA